MIINGEYYDYLNITISALLINLNISSDKVVVELNLNIIAPSEFSDITLCDSDKIEIVAFIGGG